MKFLDQAKVFVSSGAGGKGSISFRREANVEFGGPDGGNGARGGNVVIECVEGLNTLIDYRYQQHFKAKIGEHGMGQNRAGKKGEDAVLKVPLGTQVLDEDKEYILADMTEVGQKVTLLHGGNGGFGNAHFKSSTNRAPRRANPGLEGEERWVWLRLKLIADVGLVGMPNAGKSTFLAAVSRARPKIADYPFTTLHPNLGVVYANGGEFVVADIPGLIAGASEGTGLGTRFLGHVERCAVLLHLVDGTQEDPGEAYRIIRKELDTYADILANKHEIVALNKVDALSDEERDEKMAALKEACGCEVYPLSGVAQLGMKEMLNALYNVIDSVRNPEPDENEVREFSP